jgi:hypothetical protein
MVGKWGRRAAGVSASQSVVAMAATTAGMWASGAVGSLVEWTVARWADPAAAAMAVRKAACGVAWKAV